jgi:protein SDA1
MSKLATTRILTPADFAKLRELQTAAAITSSMPSAKRRRMQQQQQSADRHADDALTSADIEGLSSLSHKLTKEEKIRMAKGDPEEKNDHRSTTARRKEKKESEGKSTTNKEKARRKNFLMTLGKAKRKGKRSLVEHRKVLKAHQERQKKGGKRGNR